MSNKRAITPQGYLQWLDRHNKGNTVKHLAINLQNRHFAQIADFVADIDPAQYTELVRSGFYSSYVYAALDTYIVKNLKDLIEEATKDDNIPDDKRIERDAYLSIIKVPVFQVYAIDDTNIEDVTLYVRGMA